MNFSNSLGLGLIVVPLVAALIGPFLRCRRAAATTTLIVLLLDGAIAALAVNRTPSLFDVPLHLSAASCIALAISVLAFAGVIGTALTIDRWRAHWSEIWTPGFVGLALTTLAILLIPSLPWAGLALGAGALTLVLPLARLPDARRINAASRYAFWITLAAVGLVVVGALIALNQENPQPGFAGPALALTIVAGGTLSAAVPFHLWLPDCAELEPLVVAAIVSFLGPATGLLLVEGVPTLPWLSRSGTVSDTLLVAGVAAALLGAILALGESHPARSFALLFGSSAAIALVGIALRSEVSLAGAALLFVAQPLAASLGLIGISIGSTNGNSGTTEISSDSADSDHKLHGLFVRRPLVGIAVWISALTLLGVPPTAGFVGRWLVLRDLADQHTILALGTGVASLIGCAAVFRMLGRTFDREESLKPHPTDLADVIAIALSGLIILVGIYPTPILSAIQVALGSPS